MLKSKITVRFIMELQLKIMSSLALMYASPMTRFLALQTQMENLVKKVIGKQEQY